MLLLGFYHFGPDTDTPFMSMFSCEHTASSVLICVPCFIVSCCFMVFGCQHSCLVKSQFWHRVGAWTLMLHVLSYCVSMRSRVHSSCVVFYVARGSCAVECSSCFLSAACFHVMFCLVLCSMQLEFFIGCMLSCCHVFEHMAYEFSH